MFIYGREVKFLRTVMATCNISDMCPGGDLSQIAKLFEGTYSETHKSMASMIHFMNQGYEEAREYEEDGYKANPLSVGQIMHLSDENFNALFAEACTAYFGERQTVEVEEDKKKENQESEHQTE